MYSFIQLLQKKNHFGLHFQTRLMLSDVVAQSTRHIKSSGGIILEVHLLEHTYRYLAI